MSVPRSSPARAPHRRSLRRDPPLYVLIDSDQLSAFDATTGNALYQQARLPQPYNFKVSPIGAEGKLYLATDDEDVVVVKMAILWRCWRRIR